LEDIPTWRRTKLLGLFSQSELEYAQEVERLDDQPTLSDMVRRAIELLQYNRGGYVLVVDAALIRKARDENRTAGVTSELLELDSAVATALEYAGNKAAVLVCGDTSVTPRRAVSPAPEDTPVSSTAGEAADATNASEPVATPPTESTAATPGELPVQTAEPAADNAIASTSAEQSEPVPSPTAASTATPASDQVTDEASQRAAVAGEDAIVFGIGLGTEALRGTIEDTEIFGIIRANL
jgi:alkaline phosphatase